MVPCYHIIALLLFRFRLCKCKGQLSWARIESQPSICVLQFSMCQWDVTSPQMNNAVLNF